MFGLSFGELCVLVVVAIVVIGPKDLPRVLRKAGEMAGRLRRVAVDMRAQSGIDEVLHTEGLTKDISEIRRLASADFLSPVARPVEPVPRFDALDLSVSVVREREYPREGPDSYGATPDTAVLYAKEPVPSPFASDTLYVTGELASEGTPPSPTEAAS